MYLRFLPVSEKKAKKSLRKNRIEIVKAFWEKFKNYREQNLLG